MNGSTVAAWADQSGAGNHQTQGVASAQPLFVAGGLNGKAVVRADGVDDCMAGVGAIPGNSAHTIIVVGRLTANPANSSRSLICYGDAPVAQGSSIIGQSPLPTPPFDFGGAGQGRSDGNANTAPHIFAKTHNGTTTVGYIDEAQVVNSTITYNAVNANIRLFQISSTSGFGPAELGEVIICSGVLGASDLAKVHAYEHSYWGI